MNVFDSNKNNKWSGKGFSINKTFLVAYKNANFRHRIAIPKGQYDLRLFAKNRTGNSAILFKVVTDRNIVLASGLMKLNKNWSEESFSFNLSKNYGAGYLYFYREDGSYGSSEIGRIILSKEETVDTSGGIRNRIKQKAVSKIDIPIVKKFQKKKIGFVIPYGIYGGAEVYAETIINNVDTGMFQIHLIYIKDNPIKYALSNKRVIHKKITSKDNFLNYVKNQNIDFLVYYNSINAYRLCQLAKQKSNNGLKLIEIYHSDFKWADSLSGLKNRLNVDIAFRVSPQFLQKITGIKTKVNLPVPLDIEKFHIRDVDKMKNNIKLRLSPDKKIIGTVARLSEEKNLDYLLDLAKISDEYNFVIFGEGNKEQHLRRRMSQEKITNVRLLGFKKDVFRYYGIFDAFLLTSRMEGTPISILEAMASGIPVFTTNVGQISSIVKDNETGFFLTGNTTKDKAIIENNLFNHEVIIRAREYVETTHDQNIIAAKFTSSLMDVHNQFVKKHKIKVLAGEYV